MKFPLLAVIAILAGCSPASTPAAPQSRAATPAFEPTRFSVKVVGSGPDVILLPGLASSRDVWRDAVAALPGYRYHLVQVGGFAGEPVRGNASGEIVAPVAAELARYIRSRGLRQPALVGHSMGGTLAMMVAARNPGLVGKVMAVDMLPRPAGLFGASASGAKGLADALRGVAASPGGRELVTSVMAMFAPPAPAGARSDPDVVARATHELALTDLTPELSRIDAPLTVLYAADARVAPAADFDRTYRNAYAGRRGTRLVRIDRSGHMVMADQPAKFAGELARFLRP